MLQARSACQAPGLLKPQRQKQATGGRPSSNILTSEAGQPQASSGQGIQAGTDFLGTS